MVSMLPFIMHGFFVISSVKNFLEKKQIKDKPVIIKDGLLYPSLKKEAPLTLMRLCLAEGPLKEKDIAIIFFILSTVSSILAFLTYFLTQIKLI
jgi:UDP-N-acetylglucosamine--dolichyl-phosphate N-acetylglucosaminephosphotransferase